MTGEFPGRTIKLRSAGETVAGRERFTSGGPRMRVEPTDVRRLWAERTGAYSPTYYAHHGPDERSEAVLDVFGTFLDPGAAVLELGCSSGRHLARLHEAGFGELHGIDLNPEAFEVMAETYPALADAGTFHVGAIERLVPEFDDGRFDAVFSVETLQHVHPEDEWVFEELVRITDDLVVVVENEGDEGGDGGGERGGRADEVRHVDDGIPLYVRAWDDVFGNLGLDPVRTEALGRDTLRAFQRR